MAIDTQTHNITQIHAGSQSIAEAHIWDGAAWKKVWPDAPLIDPNAFRLRIEIPSKGYTVSFGFQDFSGGFNFSIKWGDGQTTNYVGSTTTIYHTYAQIGEFIIEITGNCQNINTKDRYYTQQCVRELLQWGNTNITHLWNTFNNCTFLSSLPQNGCIPVTSAQIIRGEFCYQGTAITETTVAEGITYIPDYLFTKSNLQTVTFSSSVRTIGIASFLQAKLTSLTLNEGLTTISAQAFQGISASENPFTEIIIPSSVVRINRNAFYSEYHVRNVISYAITPPTAGSNIFGPVANVSSIRVPSGSVAAYKAAGGWSTYAALITEI